MSAEVFVIQRECTVLEKKRNTLHYFSTYNNQKNILVTVDWKTTSLVILLFFKYHNIYIGSDILCNKFL